MVSDLFVRFLVGGALVSLFALLGDVLKPKSFAGMFGAAPSVALATLALTIRKDGPAYATVEARSMVAGAVALLACAVWVARSLHRRRRRALAVALQGLIVWAGLAIGQWAALLR